MNEAVDEYDKAIAIHEDLVNEQKRNELANELAKAYMNKGVALYSLSKSNEAVDEYDKAIAIREDLVNEQKHDELADYLAKAYMNKGNTLRNLGRLNEAIDEYDKAIKLFDDSKKVHQSWEIRLNCAKALLNKSEVFIKLKKVSQAGELIREAVESLEAVNNESLNFLVFNIIFSAAEGDDYSNIRKLLQGEELEKRFFPVLRAIDYLETGDEDVIEKLSPEVRGIVEEAVRALRQTSNADEESEPVKKTKKRKK